MTDETVQAFQFDRPGYYRIRGLGGLHKSWIDHLEGLEISTTAWNNYPEVVQIDGWLADQIALAGLMDVLMDLGLVILTVERRECE